MPVVAADANFSAIEFFEVADADAGPDEGDEMEDYKDKEDGRTENGAAAVSGGRREDIGKAGDSGAAAGVAGHAAGVSASGRGVA